MIIFLSAELIKTHINLYFFYLNNIAYINRGPSLLAGPRNVVTYEVSGKLASIFYFFIFLSRTCFYLKQLLKESVTCLAYSVIQMNSGALKQ